MGTIAIAVGLARTNGDGGSRVPAAVGLANADFDGIW